MTDSTDPVYELQLVIRAAQRVGLESPIKDYRVVGNRVELWDLHDRHFVTDLVIILDSKPSDYDIVSVFSAPDPQPSVVDKRKRKKG